MGAKIEIGDGFDETCSFDISEMATGNICISRHGPQPIIRGARIQIGACSGHIVVYVGCDGALVTFADGCIGAFDLRLWRSAAVVVGRGTTSNGAKIVCDRSSVEIGEDCMFSDEVLIQSADQHGIVDLATGRITNDRARKTIIGNHVWLGRRSTVMPDAEIGDGCLVAAGAIVTRPIPAYSICAGVPASIVRSHASWTRYADRLDEYISAVVSKDLWRS